MKRESDGRTDGRTDRSIVCFSRPKAPPPFVRKLLVAGRSVAHPVIPSSSVDALCGYRSPSRTIAICGHCSPRSFMFWLEICRCGQGARHSQERGRSVYISTVSHFRIISLLDERGQVPTCTNAMPFYFRPRCRNIAKRTFLLLLRIDRVGRCGEWRQ